MPSPPQPTISILPARTPRDLAAVRRLFRAYAASLPIDLSFQGFEKEVEGLPGRYAEETGEEIEDDERKGEAVGCIALRPLDLQGRELQTSPTTPTTKPTLHAELKRLYTLPSTRGRGLGRALLLSILRIARERGYDVVLLDTLPSMGVARALYEGFGFVELLPDGAISDGRYYDSPVEGTVFMGLDLSLLQYP
ncbi:GNAT family acetyltransferase [Aulographum hederae CBS 113979]|uniref:GNAT family acetyltransferase n=1 Tax=Aulographum hederae CBS 113979 TaxID=1176131 RepID=A0A6G1HCK0_9PEZI|nr:GNAT family acetyltransferase [Aulographum hederae CBS 113979]